MPRPHRKTKTQFKHPQSVNLAQQELAAILKDISSPPSRPPLASMTPPSSTSSPQSISIFISYSHKDEDLREELDTHLANLKRQGKIRAWHDRAIEAGAEWDAEIKQHLETAQIILLLISPRFIASDYCYDLEMQRAIQRHDEGTARVIPIILKPCDWQDSPFSKLQVLPKDAKPITTWHNQDEAFLNVTQSIRRVLETLSPQQPTTAPSPSLPPSPSPSPPPPTFSTYNPQTFTGRDSETTLLTTLLSGSCRILAIVGMTGIGKTALAERVVARLMETTANSLPYYRFSLDDRSLTPDFFSSGAALLRTLGDEPTLEDQKDPTNLLAHIFHRLCGHPCRLQIDSLERLLDGNEQDGWSEFCDPLWLDLLDQVLSANHCPSQLLLTSQDIPTDLDATASRYPQFWHCQTLQGLSADEQLNLFQKLGLLSDSDPNALDILRRIGAFYDGHPLVLQVIADEIQQPPFHGDIPRYWQHYEAEFTATSAPTANSLTRSRLFRRRVRQRVERSLQRLPDPARQMLCASAVFRRPVPIEFWYAMLPHGDPQVAFDTLQDRHLIEYTPSPSSLPPSPSSSSPSPPLLVRQHNLIRSIAYNLLKLDTPTWEAVERQAAHLWLTAYQPAPDAPNLETVRGYLEAFDHYCEVGEWDAAKKIAWIQLDTPTQDPLAWQLETWGYFREQALFHHRQLDIARKMNDIQRIGWALGNLGIAYYRLGQYERAIDFHQQNLTIAQEIGDSRGEGIALGCLGIVYDRLGQYERAIDFHQQNLTIAQEIGDSLGEGKALGNLGNAYDRLGQCERAIDLYQQTLTIAHKIGDRRSEGSALANMGATQLKLEQYPESLINNQTALDIFREIGDRQGEGIALVNMGATQLKLEQYPESLTNNQTALDIFREIGDRANEAEALKNLAELHQALGKVEVARQYCEQALALVTELGIPLKAECEKLMTELGKGEG
jgi:tetratricopeptide (TPR) repeat protein